MISVFLALLIAIQSPGPTAAQDEIKDALARAESLYFEAKFSESIQLLTHAKEVLQNKPDRVKDKISANLQLALANVGLNDAVSAKSFLREIYVLDPEYALDVQQFSPKVLTLAADAKAEQTRVRCQAADQDAAKELENGDATALVILLRTMKPRCAELSDMEPAAADLVYKKGLTEYKSGNFADALQDFRIALALAPHHDMATQYLELTQGKVQVAEDRVLLDWQKNFDAHQYSQAAVTYRQIAARDEPSETLNHMTSEYRKALQPLIESWNSSCSDADRAKISALLPDPSFAGDLRGKMSTCTSAAAAAQPGVKANAKAACLQMESQSVMTRLKSRVEPLIPREVIRTMDPRTASRVKARIDENGNLTVLDTSGSNPSFNTAVRKAAEHWKFSPAIDESGPRCVETELVFVIGQ